jgi:BioD-like phosphotransacetylase family protein
MSREGAMNTLYIASIESAGKTSLCAGIGGKLLSQGKKVGYVMPVRLSETGSAGDLESIEFLKEALKLNDPLESISPVVLSQKELWDNLTDDSQQFVKTIKETVTKIAKGKDIVIVEGLSDLIVDNVATLGCYKISEALKSKVIIVLQYFESLSPSTLVRVAEELGENLIGVIVNFVPEPRLEAIKKQLTDSFQEAGIKLLGVLPEVRSLLGITVDEIASALGGEIITCPENAGELIENVMVAMTIDSGIDYFNRKSNKAAVIRGERADMQLAALETSTRSLILTNAVRPLKQVIYQAESKHVPIVVSPDDTEQTINNIVESLSKSTFNNLRKLKRFGQILDRNVDMEYIFSALAMKH